MAFNKVLGIKLLYGFIIATLIAILVFGVLTYTKTTGNSSSSSTTSENSDTDSTNDLSQIIDTSIGFLRISTTLDNTTQITSSEENYDGNSNTCFYNDNLPGKINAKYTIVNVDQTVMNSASIAIDTGIDSEFTCSSFSINGSNDGNTWETWGSGLTIDPDVAFQRFDFNTSKTYKHVQFSCDDNSSDGYWYVCDLGIYTAK